jgi:hypothetical protein
MFRNAASSSRRRRLFFLSRRHIYSTIIQLWLWAELSWAELSRAGMCHWSTVPPLNYRLSRNSFIIAHLRSCAIYFVYSFRELEQSEIWGSNLVRSLVIYLCSSVFLVMSRQWGCNKSLPLSRIIPNIRTMVGRATAQAVSRRLPTAAPGVRAQVRSCGICGGQCGTMTGFLRVLRFPCQFSFHWLFHRHHLSSGAGIIGQLVADEPSGLSLSPPQESKKLNMLHCRTNFTPKNLIGKRLQFNFNYCTCIEEYLRVSVTIYFA